MPARTSGTYFTAMFDTASLEELVRMAGFQAMLDPEVQRALVAIGKMLVSSAQANTYRVFDNPTGRLASSIYFQVPNQFEVQVVVPVVYGHRREYSFYGPDSLGRVYPNDIPRPYLVPAVEENQEFATFVLENAVNDAIGRINV